VPTARPPVLDLSGRAAVVTGAAHGIGRGCATLLAQAGADVVVVDIDAAGLAETGALVEEAGSRAVVVAGDVRDPAVPERAADAALVSFGRLDIAVHNVGGWAGTQPAAVVDTDPDDWDAVMGLNLRATFLGCRAAARRMIDAGRGGAIVNLCSLQGLRASAMMSAYGAAKAGVAQLTQTLAVELAPHGIRVNAVAPAFIDTPSSRANVSEERRRLSAETIPLRRIGEPFDIAGPVAWLASPLSAFVTGQTIAVDGGLTTTVLRPPRG
jgi:NAD(P)-dependent dehydrogenase (short-subunit alcohol dehydrogenase family)